MTFFISDNESAYLASKSDYKFFFKGWIISQWNLPKSTDEFNISLNGLEYKAADEMLIELDLAINKLQHEKINHNKFVATRNNTRDIHFSVLYKSIWQLVIKKHVLRFVIEKLLLQIPTEISAISIFIDEEYRLAEIDFTNFFPGKNITFQFEEKKKSFKDKVTPPLKNFAYFLYSRWKELSGYGIKKVEGKRNILLILYDVMSFHMVIEHFYELVNNSDKVHLSIVVMTSGIPDAKAVDFSKVKGKNISIYQYTLFRKEHFVNHNDLYTILKSWDSRYEAVEKLGWLENQEKHYAWMSQIFKTIPADVCLTIGIASESGRAISDTARYYKVPCVNLEYGINTDDPLYINYNTKYTARACIGESNIAIWKRRGDQTEMHIPIGFCKMDKLQNFKPDAATFFKKNKLDSTRATLFFASSWCAGNKSYEIEKQALIADLSNLCHEQNWNLIIKKHPAELDPIVENVLSKNKFQNQLLFNHDEIELHEAIQYCTVATTQSSSMFVETLYFGKPFCFISKSSSGGITDLYASIKADGLFDTLRSIEELKTFVFKYLNKEEIEKYEKKVAQLREKYLFKTDGNASKRLLELLETIEFNSPMV